MAKVKSPRHVSWRGGRPRFQPGPSLRARGHKAKDLRHEDGHWFTLGEAERWSAAFCKSINRPVGPSMRRSSTPREYRDQEGFVYFLVAGERLKVGWSSVPGGRLAHLSQAASDPVRFFCCQPGSRYDEAQMHDRLAKWRTRGEWYGLSLSTLRIVEQVFGARISQLLPQNET